MHMPPSPNIQPLLRTLADDAREAFVGPLPGIDERQLTIGFDRAPDDPNTATVTVSAVLGRGYRLVTMVLVQQLETGEVTDVTANNIDPEDCAHEQHERIRQNANVMAGLVRKRIRQHHG